LPGAQRIQLWPEPNTPGADAPGRVFLTATTRRSDDNLKPPARRQLGPYSPEQLNRPKRGKTIAQRRKKARRHRLGKLQRLNAIKMKMGEPDRNRARAANLPPCKI